ncbi:MAG: hypothetical protein NTX45_07880 [Proteobacteria bacterium]|nr:hypothetical protein [Pseudomonadota bacterium]
MNTRWHGIGNLIPLFMGLLWLVLAQAAFGDTVTITYHYDALGRLDSVDHGTGSRSSFNYDPAGNITQLSVAASGTDTTPDAFSFPQKTAMPLDTLITSAPVQITGINAPASWTTSGGWACVGKTNANNCGCADTDVASSGTIINGEYICARHTSSSSYSTTTTTTVTVGGVSADFKSTTLADPNPPNTGAYFDESFNGSTLDATKWDAPQVKNNGGTYSLANGRLTVVVPGGSDGYMGQWDGQGFYPHLATTLPTSFEIRLSATELARLAKNGYKDNSGVAIQFGNGQTQISLGLYGNASGYHVDINKPGWTYYNTYVGHSIRASGQINGNAVYSAALKELDLNKPYAYDLKIVNDNGNWSFGYKEQSAADWTLSPLPNFNPQANDFAGSKPSIWVSSSDGGYTHNNGSVTVALDSFTIGPVSSPPSPVPNGFKIAFDPSSLSALGATYSGVYQSITGCNGGTAIKFSGPNQPGHVRLPNRPEWQFTTGATFDLWARVDSASGMDGFGNTNSSNWAMALIAKSHDNTGFAISTNAPDPNSTGTGYGFASFASGDNSWSGTGCQALKRNPGIPLNTWFRLTLTASSTGGVATYLNKELIYNCPNARPNFSVANQHDLYIGKFSDSWYPLNGAIQDLTIYQTALTATQVQALTDGSTPNAFSFAPKTAMPLATLVTSAPVQITGINVSSAWTVTNGWACVGTTNATNCGCSDVAFNSSGTINNGEYICARHTSSSSYSSTITSLVTVSGVSASFQSTTTVLPKLGQSISFGAAPSLIIIGGTAKVSATGGASGNPVIFSSTTPLVCSASGFNGSTVTGLAVGNCIITANQAGNDNYIAASPVTQSINVTAGITLTVNNLNPTFGAVTSNPVGIMCGTTCSLNFASGTLITLTAVPASSDYQFTGWGGNCSGFGNSCIVTTDAAKSVTANFEVFKPKRKKAWKWLF